jgi:hypothetical protein
MAVTSSHWAEALARGMAGPALAAQKDKAEAEERATSVTMLVRQGSEASSSTTEKVQAMEEGTVPPALSGASAGWKLSVASTVYSCLLLQLEDWPSTCSLLCTQMPAPQGATEGGASRVGRTPASPSQDREVKEARKEPWEALLLAATGMPEEALRSREMEEECTQSCAAQSCSRLLRSRATRGILEEQELEQEQGSGSSSSSSAEGLEELEVPLSLSAAEASAERQQLLQRPMPESYEAYRLSRAR